MMSAPAIPFLRSAATPVVRTRIAPRAFSTSTIHWNAGSAPLPARKPVGAFRGGLFGFLVGSVLAGASVYYYVLAEYRVSNEMLTDDIFALQSATQKLNRYITELETKVDELQKKSK